MQNTNEKTNQLNRKIKNDANPCNRTHTHHLILKSKKISANFALYCDIKKLTKLYESLTGFT